MNNISDLVYIIIVNWNGEKDTIKCLLSLRKLNYPKYKIIVVDNGSTDDSIKKLKEEKNIELVKLKNNFGFSYANNIGIKIAIKNNAKYILLLNNDTIVSPDLLKQFVITINDYPETGALAAKVYYYDNPKKIWFAGGKIRKKGEFPIHLGFDEIDNGQFEKVSDTPFINGSAFFVRVDVIKKVGLLDERYFYMYEDADWTTRILQAGFRCLFVPSAKIWHKVHNSTKGRTPSWWYYDERSRLLWTKSNAPHRNLYLEVLPTIFSIIEEIGLPLFKKPYNQWCKYWKIGIYRWGAKIIGIYDYLRNYTGECPEFIKKMVI